MDPLSALSVAGCIVQFVDFSSRVLENGMEIYKSAIGQSSNIEDISKLAGTLLSLSSRVEEKSRLLGQAPAGSSDDVFLRLCHECNEISAEIQGSLSKLDLKLRNEKGFGRVSRVFAVAIKEIWSSEKLQRMNTRLSKIREEMMLAVLVFLWYVGRATSV